MVLVKVHPAKQAVNFVSLALGNINCIPWAEWTGRVPRPALELTIGLTIFRPRIEGLVEETIEIGRGEEGLVPECRKRHDEKKRLSRGYVE
jgi:hypothetical protein